MPKRSREEEEAAMVVDRILVNHTCPVSLHLLADAVSVNGKAYNVRLPPAAGTVTDSVGCFLAAELRHEDNYVDGQGRLSRGMQCM